MELPVGHVEASALQLNVQRGEGFHAQQIVEHARRIGVVSAVVELGYGTRGILEGIILAAHLSLVFGVYLERERERERKLFILKSK